MLSAIWKACNFTKSDTTPWVFFKFVNGTNGSKSHIGLVMFSFISILPSILDSPWERGQIGIKLGTKHIIYQKLANFL